MDEEHFTTGAWTDGMRQFQDEAHGVMRLFVIPQTAVAAVLSDAVHGNELAPILLGAMTQSVDRIETAPWENPILCFCCCARIRHSDRIAHCVVLPDVASPDNAIGAVACPKCARKPNLFERVTATLRIIWPDARPVNVSAQVGRA